MSEWQPIETAPHETYLLLGWLEEWPDLRWQYEIGFASHGSSWPAENGGRYSNYAAHGRATHWMLLPEPPEGEQG